MRASFFAAVFLTLNATSLQAEVYSFATKAGTLEVSCQKGPVQRFEYMVDYKQLALTSSPCSSNESGLTVDHIFRTQTSTALFIQEWTLGATLSHLNIVYLDQRRKISVVRIPFIYFFSEPKQVNPHVFTAGIVVLGPTMQNGDHRLLECDFVLNFEQRNVTLTSGPPTCLDRAQIRDVVADE